jgi:hypothetical protein
MFKRLMLLAFAALLSLAVASAAEASQYYFKFNIQSPKELDELTKIVSIDDVKDNVVYAYANDAELAKLAASGYSYTMLPNPIEGANPEMAKGLRDAKAWDVYPTYQQYLDMMSQFETNYPTICKVINFGSTIQGRQLLALKISDNVNTAEDEPEAWLTSSIHGDEVTGYVTTLRLADSILTTYGTDARITNLVDNLEIYITPLANPDGTYHGGNNSVSGAQRYNANDVDLNRNYWDPADGQHPDGYAWQVETVANMNFMAAHHFVISANFHGGAEVVNYPWDTWSRLHPDDTWWQQISRRFADTVHVYGPSGYLTDLQNGITNGYAWYRVAGGRQDYMTYFMHGREATIEISNTKMPSASTLPTYWVSLRKSLLNWISESLYGVRGVVTSATTGLPLGAKVTVMSHDADSSQIYTDPAVGDYHRMIAPGTWTLKFECAAYVPQTITGVNVTNLNTTILNVQMQPLSPYPIINYVSNNAPASIHPGDNVLLNVSVENDGGSNATTLQGVLSSADANVTVTQSTSLYPTIAAFGGTGASISQYGFSVSPTCPDNHVATFLLVLAADGDYHDTVTFDMILARPIENFETGNFVSYPWQFPGILPWTAVTTAPYEGSYCAQSGAITHSQSTKMSAVLTVLANGNISFSYKVSSELNWDLLKFRIDGTVMGQWSGTVAWTQATYPVTAGNHTFMWEYAKDGSQSVGSDKAWVDQIIFPPVQGAVIPPLGIVTATIPDGWVGKAYSQQLTASGGTAPYTWTDLNNDLDSSGLTLSSSGLLSGMPVKAKQISFTARVQDATRGTSSKAYTFMVYMNGDADGTGTVDISDAVYLIAYIFNGGSAPEPLVVGDANCDLAVDISDVVYLISYIFGGGPAPCVAGK